MTAVTPVARWSAIAGLSVALAGAGLLATTRAHGVSTGEETPVTSMEQRFGPSNNSPTILADPRDSRFVVIANRLDAPDFGCALQLSGDGGRSWVTGAPVPALAEGAEKCYAPEVAFDRSGRLYYLYVGLRGGGNEPMGVYLTSTDDHGATFAPARKILGPSNFSVRMAIDRSTGARGRIHLVWVHANSEPPLGGFPNGANPILAAHSDDGGVTFSEPVQVNDANRPYAVGPALVLGPGHAVHVAYYDLGDDRRDYQGLEGPVWDGTWSVVMASSADDGGRFGPGAVIDDQVVAPERVMLIFTMPPPSLVVSAHLACAAWTDARYGDPDALARCSRDGGRRWDAVRRLNDDGKGNGHRQSLPRLGLSGHGRVDAIFLDRRTDPLNLRSNLVYTYSADGGRHFAPNITVTHERSAGNIGQRYGNRSAAGQVEFGSRLGLLVTRRGILAAWPDTRNSSTATGQDLFVTRIEPASRHHLRVVVGWGLTAAGSAIFLTAVGATALRRRRRRLRRPDPAATVDRPRVAA